MNKETSNHAADEINARLNEAQALRTELAEGRAIINELRAALAGAPTSPTPEVEPVQPFWPPVQETIDNYLDGYELDDGEICHAPSAVEAFLIKDAIAGLLNDDEFMAAFQTWVNAYRSYRNGQAE